MDLIGVLLGFLLGRATSSIPTPPIPWPGNTPPPVPPVPPGVIPPGVVPPVFPTGTDTPVWGKKKGPTGLPIPQPMGFFPFPAILPTPAQVQPQPQPQPQPQASPVGLTYTIASGDTAVAVSQRFNGGQVKRADGRWIWKELDHASPPLATTGATPVPWTVGATLVLPSAWNADSGPRSGARGAVGAAVSGYDDDHQVEGDDGGMQTV